MNQSVAKFTVALALLLVVSRAHADNKPVCLYISSYHQGYAWSDGVERGLRRTINDECEIVQHDMNTKRKKSTAEKEAAGARAFELVQDLKPDVVITSDDNAAKYLVVPYLKDTNVPVIFSGVNWTVKEYDFPASNVTGIVEVAPIKPMLTEALRISNGRSNAAYLGALTLSERKNFNRIHSVAETMGITMTGIFAEHFAGWEAGLNVAQQYDFVIMGSHSGISDWFENRAIEIAARETRKMSLTNHDWMMPYSVIGYTKIPEEHGEWAAASAIAVLSGIRVVDIPLVTNRKWDTWLNEKLLSNTGITLDGKLFKRAKKVR